MSNRPLWIPFQRSAGRTVMSRNTVNPLIKVSRPQLLMAVAILAAIPMRVQSQECYPCQDVNKQSQNLESCTNTEADCGTCLDGFQEYSWDPFSYCGIPGSVILEPNGNASLPFDSPTILKCQFDVPVSCVWQKNDFMVNPSELRFVVNSGGLNTTDCSIQTAVNWNDAGKWECSSLADDSGTASIIGSTAFLTIKATVTEQPQDSPVQPGGNVTLQCHFDLNVSCFWTHNGTKTDVVDRYRYQGGDGTGKDTTDCSIEITKFMDDDAGEWKCGCEGSSALDSTVSDAAWLTISPPDDDTGLASWLIVTIVIVTIVVLIVIISAIICTVRNCKQRPDGPHQHPEVSYERGHAEIRLPGDP